jgi:hypothetical protein
MKHARPLVQLGLGGLIAASMMAPLAANATTTTYTSAAAYAVAAGAQTTEDFNSPTGSTATSVSFSDVVFSCSGTTYCPGFFGSSSLFVLDGLSVFFATPDTATFTFSSAIKSFGVLIAGLGDIGTTTLNIANSNGFSADIFSSYTGTTTNFITESLFAGLTSDTPFTTVTFSGLRPGDGIFFENLSFGKASVVPLPAALPLLGAAMLGLGMIGRQRRKVAP